MSAHEGGDHSATTASAGDADCGTSSTESVTGVKLQCMSAAELLIPRAPRNDFAPEEEESCGGTIGMVRTCVLTSSPKQCAPLPFAYSVGADCESLGVVLVRCELPTSLGLPIEMAQVDRSNGQTSIEEETSVSTKSLRALGWLMDINPATGKKNWLGELP